MPYPERNNEITEYEEIWRGLPIPAGPGEQVSWILQSVAEAGNKHITFLGRMGGVFFAFKKPESQAYGVRREVWDASKGEWQAVYAIAADKAGVPSIVGKKDGFAGEGGWKEGDVVEVLGGKYEVKAWEKVKA